MKLDHISASSIALVETCPAAWKACYVDKRKRPSSPMAEVGTAVHELAAAYLSRCSWDIVERMPEWGKIPMSEHDSVKDYLHSLEPAHGRVLGVEYKFHLSLAPDAPPVLGYIDCLSVTEDGSLLITDHKTNRTYDNIDTWRDKVQTQVYALAAYHIDDLKVYPRVRVRVGYVNLGKVVEWEHDPAHNDAIIERIQRAWEMMSSTKHRMVLNDDCRWCVIKDECSIYKDNIVNFSESLVKFFPGDIVERWNHLKTVSKLVSSLLDEVEAQLVTRLGESDVTHQGTRYYLETGSRRSVEFRSLWEALCKAHDELDPTLLPRVLDVAEDLFTVKVGGIDKLLKADPGLDALIKPLVASRPNDKPSIKVKKT